jgi:hypothetical protein
MQKCSRDIDAECRTSLASAFTQVAGQPASQRESFDLSRHNPSLPPFTEGFLERGNSGACDRYSEAEIDCLTERSNSSRVALSAALPSSRSSEMEMATRSLQVRFVIFFRIDLMPYPFYQIFEIPG